MGDSWTYAECWPRTKKKKKSWLPCGEKEGQGSAVRMRMRMAPLARAGGRAQNLLHLQPLSVAPDVARARVAATAQQQAGRASSAARQQTHARAARCRAARGSAGAQTSRRVRRLSLCPCLCLCLDWRTGGRTAGGLLARTSVASPGSARGCAPGRATVCHGEPR